MAWSRTKFLCCAESGDVEARTEVRPEPTMVDWVDQVPLAICRPRCCGNEDRSGTIGAVKEICAIGDVTELVAGSKEFEARNHVRDATLFTIVVDKNSDTSASLGLHMDASDGRTLMVNGVVGGLIGKWNQTNPDMQVQPCDRIVAVNSVDGDARILLEVMKIQKTLKIKVKRPEKFRVSLRKVSEGADLGLEMSYAQDACTLLVKKILPGMVHEWNMANRGEAVHIHDRVFEVNGVKGDAPKLFSILSSSGSLDIVFLKGSD